jgi:regulator of protease activity HflC (stomatin/prohibitin superfamily)
MIRINWKRLLITLAAGIGPTAISYLLGWWWGGTAFALLTFFGVLFAFPRQLDTLLFTLYAALVIAVLSGAAIEARMPAEWGIGRGARVAIAGVGGLMTGILPAVIFWFSIFYVSTKWIMTVSKSFDISWGQALRFVSARSLGITQAAIVVQNGAIAFEAPRGMLSALGGPGFLVIGVGNACVLERSGKVTRIVGPGFHKLERFERLKEPVDGKGIVDLRPQFDKDVAKDVRTKDGIPLKIKVGEFFRIEPQHITDARPASRFSGGAATTKLLGEPEHPVYEATVHKAVFNVPEEGWKDAWFPSEPINHLRDVVATYTLDEVFGFDKSGVKLSPADRVVQEIEEEVRKRFDPSPGGVWFERLDIREISMPEELEEKVMERWTARVERELRLEQAKTERDALIEVSQGRAKAIEQVETVRLAARSNMTHVVSDLVTALSTISQEHVAMSFVSVIQELTNRVGQDETVAMRYIQAMQAIVESEGPKSFVVTPQAPGLTLSPPAQPPDT